MPPDSGRLKLAGNADFTSHEIRTVVARVPGRICDGSV